MTVIGKLSDDSGTTGERARNVKTAQSKIVHRAKEPRGYLPGNEEGR